VIRRRIAASLAICALAAGCGATGSGLHVEGSVSIHSGPSGSTGPQSTTPPPPARAGCDPRSGCVDTTESVSQPAAIAFAGGSLWAAVYPGSGLVGSLVQIDATTGRRTGSATALPPSDTAYHLVGAGGDLFLACTSAVWRITPATATVQRVATVPFRIAAETLAAGSVWAVGSIGGRGFVAKLRTDGHETTITPTAGPAPISITVVPGAVWIGDADRQTVQRLRVTGAGPAAPAIPLPRRPIRRPAQLTVTDGLLWVFDRNAVLALDHGRLLSTTTIEPAASGDMAAGAAGLWVSGVQPRQHGRGVVLRLDPRSGIVVGHPIVVGGRISALATGGGFVWAMDVNGVISRITPGTG
jgi:hypothetical protein